MSGRTHGLAGTYRANPGCRCGACRTAHTSRTRAEQEARKQRLAADPTLRPHGEVLTYTNWLCRCQDCTSAHSQWLREYRNRGREAS